jgi:hypothetical protein
MADQKFSQMAIGGALQTNDIVVGLRSGVNTQFTVTADGLPWTMVTLTTQTIAPNNAYFANNAALVVFTLPAASAVGDEFEIAGLGAGGWKISQRAGQSIITDTATTTVGTSGNLSSSLYTASVRCVCTVANTTWKVLGGSSNLLLN